VETGNPRIAATLREAAESYLATMKSHHWIVWRRLDFGQPPGPTEYDIGESKPKPGR